MCIRLPHLALIAVLAVATTATALEVSVLRTLGGDDDDLLLHNPMSVSYAPDGSIYLLNSGECQVLHLDSDWNLLNAFGRCGQGPGEFENPVGMVMYDGQVWVFEMARIVVYALDGALVKTLVPGVQYSSVGVIDGRLTAVMGMGDRTAAWLDDEGKPITWFGPACPEDFFEAFKTCRNMHVLPHDEGACLLLNPIAGRVHLVGDDGDDVWARDLIELEDHSSMTTSDDGRSATMTLSFGMGLGCRDPEGRYWFSMLPEEEGDRARLRVTDAEMAALGGDVVLPEDVFGWELSFSPRGELVLLSPMESMITVCEVVEN